MKNINNYLLTLFATLVIIYLALHILEGTLVLVILAIGILILLTSTSVFIKNRFPDSKIAKVVLRIFKWLEDFFEQLGGWI